MSINIKKPWFMGICESCNESRSVRKSYKGAEIGFYCWACVADSEWKKLHDAKPFQILNVREWAKR